MDGWNFSFTKRKPNNFYFFCKVTFNNYLNHYANDIVHIWPAYGKHMRIIWPQTHKVKEIHSKTLPKVSMSALKWSQSKEWNLIRLRRNCWNWRDLGEKAVWPLLLPFSNFCKVEKLFELMLIQLLWTFQKLKNP